jgi:hypothetical protein
MQVTITQTEIESAILEYMNKRISISADSEVSVDIKSTRGADGFTAIIDIIDNLEDHAALIEREKQRRTKVKEEELAEAGRFLKEVKDSTSTAGKAKEEVVAESSSSNDVEPAKEETVDAKESIPKPKKPASIFGNVTKA